MEEVNEIKFQISPKFNFLYELGMPTGKKIKKTLILGIILVIGYIVFLFNINVFNNAKVGDIKLSSIINVALIILMFFAVIKIVIHIVFQHLQYKNIIYKFYSDHMTYEDNFLNQHKKNILYSNIKEVEIRRTVWDRVMGYGIIVIYTNAENEYSNGLVIFGIKDAKKHYDVIDKLVHSNSSITTDNDSIKEDNTNNEVDKTVNNNVEEEKTEEKNQESDNQTHEEFLESLKNIEK